MLARNMIGIFFLFLPIGRAVSTCEGHDCQGGSSASALLQVDLRRSSSTATLPEFCAKIQKTTPEECLNECYDQETASNKAEADREMAWGIVGAVAGGAGDVFDAMPSKKKQDSELLLQLSANATTKNKFVGMIVAGVSIAAGIGNAISDRGAAYASADSQNCEQLGSLLMQQGMTMLGSKLDKVTEKVEESIKKLDLVRQDIDELKTILGQVEERLTEQLDTLSSGQDALMLQVDKTMQELNRLNLLNRNNALNTKMTEYFRCAGNVGHAFDTIQGVISDQETYKYGFKHVLVSGQASQAAEWQNRYSIWYSNLLPLLDNTAIHALEGMNCMAVLISTGGLLESYYVEMAQEFLRRFLQTKSNGFQALDDVYKMSTDVAAQVFQHDEVLVSSLNAISQVRYVLSAAPREGYWNDFAVYAKSLEVGFTHATKYLQTSHFMNLIRTGLADAAPVIFAPSLGCLTAMGSTFPQMSSLSMWTQTSSTKQMLVSSIETLLSVNEDEPIYKNRGSFFECTCNDQGSCTVAASAPRLNANFGFSGEALGGSRISSTMDMAKSKLRTMITRRQTAMAAWGCRAKDIGERSKAVNAFKSCLQGADDKKMAASTAKACLSQSSVSCPPSSSCSAWLPQCRASASPAPPNPVQPRPAPAPPPRRRRTATPRRRRTATPRRRRTATPRRRRTANPRGTAGPRL
eukprot:TRINITY_DN1080_c0_g1_i1.p1 TRINITY_DN1080_c0_g1~~TRINITY_DN1080_c0_g1_i1.p1  ORF type:complete len:692 (-),score=107.36 TRINITY_DN1080_c0_g1_i1:177-2252(-)